MSARQLLLRLRRAKRSDVDFEADRIFGSLRWVDDGGEYKHSEEWWFWFYPCSTGNQASHFPIPWLPPEILADIFYWYIIKVYRVGHTTLPYPNPYCWMAIRHVCRSWRQVALSVHKLSTYICLTCPAVVQDLLDRSGEMPLTVYGCREWRCEWHSAQETFRLVLPHFGRIVHCESFAFPRDNVHRQLSFDVLRYCTTLAQMS